MYVSSKDGIECYDTLFGRNMFVSLGIYFSSMADTLIEAARN